MYKFIVKDKEYSIPKENIRLFALVCKAKVNPKTDDEAIEYLASIGIKVIKDSENV